MNDLAHERTNPGLKTHRDSPIIDKPGKLQSGESYRFTATGLLFNPKYDPTFDEFDALGQRTMGVVVASYFAFCDWFEWGRAKFGEMIYQAKSIEVAKDHFGLNVNKNTLDQILSTGRRILPENRDIPVTISHHREAANLKDKTKQRPLLEKVAKEGLTVTQTRAEVTRANRKPGVKAPEVPEPFKFSFSYPAGKPGQSRKQWYELAVGVGIQKLKEALERHLEPKTKESKVKAAKTRSRKESRKRR